jgi:hypothetical protein
MNSVQRHIKYVHDLSALVKESKTETREVLMKRLSALMDRANGNPYLFQRLIDADRKNILGLLIPLVLKRRKQAGELGRQFGEDRRDIVKRPV